MDNVLAANVGMVRSASSKPDEDFEALLLQYQNSASGPMSSSEPTTISADAYGEIPERSSYYDYDSGRMIYGVDRYNAVAPAPAFVGGGGQVDRNLGYYYQGSQWAIPGLSYFPGPMVPQQQQQQPDQSTFSMLNQYHMQLRMLMSPSPRPAPAQRVGPAEPFVDERYGQQAYPPPPLPPTALPSLQLPSYAEYSSYGSSAPPSAEPMHGPASVRPAIDDGQLSDGELESASGDYDHGYIGGGIGTTAGVDDMDAASQHGGQQDVEGVAKERISQMLKMKEPKLLQSSSFRGLMLLLKCIRLDDPDDIYAAVRSAPTQVISELNALSAEFGLGMITEACVSTLLTDDSSALRANLELGAAEAAATATPLAGGSSAARSREGSLSAAGNESSTPDSDMDTSSDVDYEDQPPAFAQAGGSKPGTRPMAHFSRETTPQFQARFSRSRAPSPPSAQPRTPRRVSCGRGSPTPSGAEGRGRIGGSGLNVHSGLSIGNSRLFGGAEHSWRVAESTVCASGTDRLVVYLDDSHSDSESSVDGGSGDDELRARDRARRLDNRMINR
ncbi:hypothetical protein H4S07_005756, partial [Coemansia furcata]